ncbi:Outer Dynein Arm Light Chain 2 [Thraustotheca clavata]|uniref:Outer Dynein Arm Light Chain 2 n=1 Tax=Thraustotheca clavata TaxID=74557 RepID=A0A1V9ZVC7_9STRA|nr:Outer Dynein Arm Light Chain 2 [Thraustotheca clavata]
MRNLGTNSDDLDALLVEHDDAINELRRLVKDVLEPQYDDVWLLRFLISNGTPSASEEPVRYTIKWRAGRKVLLEKIRNGASAPFHDEITKYQVIGDHKHTSLGEPLFFVRVGLCNAISLMNNVSYNDILEYMLLSREKMVADLEVKTRSQRKLIKGISVLDFAGYSLRWGTEPRFSKLLGECSELMEKMYPQLIGQSILVNTPSYFSWFFRVLKPFLSESTLSKIVVCPGGTSIADCPYMSKYLVLSDLPSFLGGDCTCNGKGCIGKIPNSQTTPIKESGSNGLAVLTVAARSVQTIDIPIKPGKRFVYSVGVPGKAVNVSIVFRTVDIPILPKQSIAKSNDLLDGAWLAPKEGVVSITFENSALFDTSKTIMVDADTSGSSSKNAQIIKIYMPTYIMAPTEDEKFRRRKVCGIVSECLKNELQGKEYDEEDAKQWCNSIADAIKNRVKADCNFPRYKIIVQAFVGQQKLQDVRIASRCLWDNDNDNHASAEFHNETIWATCIVFGLYSD